MTQQTVIIDGIEYVKKGSNVAETLDGLDYVIVRTYSAGVFAGYLKSREGKEVILLNARRLWQWSGAASLSQLAISGTSNPDGCKFPEEVGEVTLTEAIEILQVTQEGKDSIASVSVWAK